MFEYFVSIGTLLYYAKVDASYNIERSARLAFLHTALANEENA